MSHLRDAAKARYTKEHKTFSAGGLLRFTSEIIKNMKIDLDDPPDWITCACNRCVQIRQTIAGTPHVPVCDKCGTIMVYKSHPPRIMENCEGCVPVTQEDDSNAQ